MDLLRDISTLMFSAPHDAGAPQPITQPPHRVPGAMVSGIFHTLARHKAESLVDMISRFSPPVGNGLHTLQPPGPAYIHHPGVPQAALDRHGFILDALHPVQTQLTAFDRDLHSALTAMRHALDTGLPPLPPHPTLPQPSTVAPSPSPHGPPPPLPPRHTRPGYAARLERRPAFASPQVPPHELPQQPVQGPGHEEWPQRTPEDEAAFVGARDHFEHVGRNNAVALTGGSAAGRHQVQPHLRHGHDADSVSGDSAGESGNGTAP